jgi:hypothetical protein
MAFEVGQLDGWPKKRRPKDWVEPILKQSIASFYGADLGRCLESIENLLRSKDGQRPKNTLSIVAM